MGNLFDIRKAAFFVFSGKELTTNLSDVNDVRSTMIIWRAIVRTDSGDTRRREFYAPACFVERIHPARTA
jgi:hypothetical protein